MDTFDSNLNKQIGILICGHGSRNKLAITEFQELTRLIQKKYPSILVEFGFLEFAKPSLAQLDVVPPLQTQRYSDFGDDL